MSDLFRVSIPPEIQDASLALLAILCHEAEDSGDDVLLLQVTGELERRASELKFPSCLRVEFMGHYRAAMEVRVAKAKARS
jgi:hypothetical protein